MNLHQYNMNKYLFTVCTVFCLLACNDHPGMEQTDETYISINANVADRFSRSGENIAADRCIQEVYTTDGTQYGERQVSTLVGGNVEFNVRVIAGQSYTLVFWADKSSTGSNDDNHYDTSTGLRHITVKAGYSGNNDEFDAYYASVPIVADASTLKAVQLSRPFCRVNVTARDENLPTELGKIKIEFKDVYTEFDALTSEVSKPRTMEYTTAVLSDKNMSFDYLFAPGGKEDEVNFTMSFYRDDGTTTIGKPFDFTGIPLKRNYQVNVSAKLFAETGGTNIALTGIE